MYEDEYFIDFYISGIKTNYLISNYGRFKHIKTGKFKSYYTNNSGRKCCSFSVDGINTAKTVARWLALSFIPPIAGYSVSELEADHIDGDPTNDILSNIQWLTSQDNERKRNTSDNKSNVGERNGMAKITSEIVLKKILNDIVSGMKTSEISLKYNVPIPTINSIRCKNAWTHLSKDFNLSDIIMIKSRSPKKLRDTIYTTIKNNPLLSNTEIIHKLNLSKDRKQLVKNIRSKIKRESSTTIENDENQYYTIDIHL